MFMTKKKLNRVQLKSITMNCMHRTACILLACKYEL